MLLVLGGVGVAMTPCAAAQDLASATCAQVRELSDAQRSLWLSPSTTLQLVRAPGQGMDDPTGYLARDGWQVRWVVSASPVDYGRAHIARRLAVASCLRYELEALIGEYLRAGPRVGEDAALRARIEVVRAQLPEMRALRARHRASRDAGLLTHDDVDVLEELVARLELTEVSDMAQLEFVSVELSRLEGVSLARLLSDYQRVASVEASLQSRQRRLQAWDARVVVGVIPGRESDWYGQATLTYNLGQNAQRRHERAGLQAAEEARGTALESLLVRAERLVHQLRARVAVASAELASAGVRRDRMRTELRELEAHMGSETRELVRRRDRLSASLVEVDVEVAYLEQLVGALAAVLRDFQEPADG
ncbi:MAG: hypothetical protein R3B40_30890 [Polyangiales bacterium]